MNESGVKSASFILDHSRQSTRYFLENLTDRRLEMGLYMFVRRASLLLLLMLPIAMVAGCDSSKRTTLQAEKYPVRADWLVINTPNAGQPSRMFEPGYAPLTMLNNSFDTLTGDDAIFVKEVKEKKNILNCARVDEEVRQELGKCLTRIEIEDQPAADMFGTPTDPKVPSGEMLIKALKWEDELSKLKQAHEQKKTELAALRRSAASKEDLALADLLNTQVETAAADVAKMQENIGYLQAYEGELKLDATTLKNGAVVFRNYCQQCHGLTGDGNGPAGKSLVPMPRDYRQGLFKFINSDPTLGAKRKPSRADLYRTITKGLDGSPMPQFAALQEEQLQSVISYVLHLSMRGETEYEVMKDAARDPNVSEPISKGEVQPAVLRNAAIVAPRWVASARYAIVPDLNLYTTEDQVEKSAANGYELFKSAQVGCMTCHSGFGRSAPYQYDSWGTIVRPRNLTIATLRGGRSPEAIYARILGGIPGSNMPAHTHLRPTIEDKVKGANKIWDLVNFVLYVSESEKRQVLKDKFQIEIDQ